MTPMPPARSSFLHEAVLPTPLGPMRLVAADEGLCLARFVDAGDAGPDLEFLTGALGRPVKEGGHPLLDRAGRQLGEYFAGERRAFDVPVLLPGTGFEQQVWGVLQRIPHGSTWSYARVAGEAGCRGGARAVGGANARNRVIILVPCHRVVPTSGDIGGFSAGPWRKRWLLELEATGRPPAPMATPVIPCAC